jgi:hypothetical protein
MDDDEDLDDHTTPAHRGHTAVRRERGVASRAEIAAGKLPAAGELVRDFARRRTELSGLLSERSQHLYYHT